MASDYQFDKMKKLLLVLMLLSSKQIVFAQNNPIDLQFSNTMYMRIEPCTPEILRIRIRKNADFKESLMERYSIVKTNWDKFDCETTTKNELTTIKTKAVKVTIDTKNRSVFYTDNTGKNIGHSIHFSIGDSSNNTALFTQSLTNFFGTEKHSTYINGDSAKPVITERPVVTPIEKPSMLNFSLTNTERFYGLGSAIRDCIQHRGTTAKIWVKYQQSEAPMPYIMSTEGWGVFYNSTKLHYFDVGRFESNTMSVYGSDEEIDFYLMIGSMPEILDHYTTITGKPFLLPKYAYGFSFGSNLNENQFNILDNAVRFRKEKFPCDVYWIETQWMANAKNFNYDFTNKKKWDYNNFRPDWPEFQGWENPADIKRHLFIYRLNKLGFKLPLWLCVDEDLSIPEEIRLAQKKGRPLVGVDNWFSHLTNFLKDGVSGYKIDPGRTIEEHPNRKYYNGFTDNEMHQLQQVLVAKNVQLTCSEFNQQRPFLHYCGGYAGIQQWAAATSGDNGGGRKAMFDQLNLGMSGHINTSCDILEQVFPMSAGLHFGFLLPWVQLNSWAFVHHPWYYTEPEKNMFHFYDSLRYSLIPYLYSTAINGTLTGMPILRAMPLLYPADTELANNTTQYMLGDNLLVAAFTNTIYLPKGNWIDYWTGNKYKGKQSIKLDIPTNRGGLLFIKAGAIIPYQKPMQYVDEFPADTITLKIYPSGESSYTLYEDDGISYKYKEGALAKTNITCKLKDKMVQLFISKRLGLYENMPLHRVYLVELYGAQEDRIIVNNVALKNENLVKDKKYNVIKFAVAVE